MGFIGLRSSSAGILKSLVNGVSFWKETMLIMQLTKQSIIGLRLSKIQFEDLRFKKKDTYNMNKKRFGMGLTGKEKVFCSKKNLQPYIKKPTNTEWVFLLECISADGRILPLYIIFKVKIMMETWVKEIKKKFV